MTDSVARLNEVSHFYKQVEALKALKLDIPAGKMVALLGPDAVGKSTLLSIIAGTKIIQSGTVEVLNGDMRSPKHRKQITRRLAYMPQGLGKSLFKELTVQENLDFFSRLFGQTTAEGKDRMKALLAATDLSEFTQRQAGQLSGGMKQKLGLCCALLHDPELLILDEPTTGVDPVSRQQFWELIKSLRVLNPTMSVIVSTAYMDEAEQFDYIVAMHAGTILACGSPQQLMQETAQESLEDVFTTLMPKPESPAPASSRKQVHGQVWQNEIAIQARNLTRRFGQFTAVDQVSFDIKRGEIFGFLGSNGCGKTTTMKMLTGLLSPSEGAATLFGESLQGRQRAARYRVGYMSQGFSLYGELTVAQNLELHARLYHLSKSDASKRIQDLLGRFQLSQFINKPAGELPLGIKQRLSLAIAIIHKPDVLILDEPTSGVDPIAREQLWDALVELSRQHGVTIFISTHFMTEAMRCDRVSLMHAGRVLASDTPQRLIETSQTETFEQAAIKLIKSAMPESGDSRTTDMLAINENAQPRSDNRLKRSIRQSRMLGSWRRLWAHSIREFQEVRRDPVRLVFALLGMVIMQFILTYGMISTADVYRFAVLDQDQTPQSRAYLANIAGSAYFELVSEANTANQLRDLLVADQVDFTIEIPAGYGRNTLSKAHAAQLLITVDGANPSQAAQVESYIVSAHTLYAKTTETRAGPAEVELLAPYFRYNPTLDAITAMAPAMPAILLIFFPSLLGAISVVKEKEIGTINNFYVTPASKLEFLVGKQLPYLLIGFINFLILLGSVIFVMQVELKGSLTMMCLGAFVYLVVATNYGMFTSTFSKSQTGAIFVTAILSILPTVSFSGLNQPVSTLSGGAQLIGQFWPTTYFMNISHGSFSKGMDFASLWSELVLLSLFVPAFLGLALLFLRKQEK